MLAVLEPGRAGGEGDEGRLGWADAEYGRDVGAPSCSHEPQLTTSRPPRILFLEEFRSPNKSSVVRHRSKSSSLSVSSLPPPDAFIPPPAASDWSDPFVPEQVYESIKPNKRFDAMRRGHQEDAEEFLGFFLDTLHDEILVMIDRVDKGKMPEQEGGGAAQEWLEVGSKGRTATTRTVSGARV